MSDEIPAPHQRLELVCASRAEDAGLLAAADLAGIASELGVPYRLLGGLSVTLLTWVHGVADRVPGRETADADFGAALDVIAGDRLPAALRGRGYHQVEGNRFVRTVARADGPLPLTVDLLIPSHDTRLAPDVPAGDLVVDAVPGLALALARPGTVITMLSRLSLGEKLDATLVVPDIESALCLKAYAYRGRFADRDAVDIWRLLEAADVAGVRAANWSLKGARLDAARILHQFFGSPRGQGPAAATREAGQQARIRALVRRVVAAPTL